MDRKSLIAMAVLFFALVGYQIFIDKVVKPKHPEWTFGPTSTTQPTDNSANSNNSAPSTVPSSPGNETLSAAPSNDVAPSLPTTLPTTNPSSTLQVAGGNPVAGIKVGSDEPSDADYALGVNLTPDGAALQSVIVNEARSVDERSLYSFQEAYDNDWRALGTRTVTVNGLAVDLSNVKWAMESHTQTKASFGVNVLDAKGSPILHLTKTYEVEARGPKKDRDKTSAGYEMAVTYHLTDVATVPEVVKLAFDGPTMPPREAERMDDRQIVAGYDKGDQSIQVVRVAPSELKPGSEQRDLSHNSNGNAFLWAGSSSLYFGAIVQPMTAGQVNWVQAVAQNPQDPPENRQIVLNFRTTDLQLTAGSSVDVPLQVFLGPKRREMLEGDFYALFPRGFNQLLVSNSSFCGICAFPWLVDGLIKLLSILQWIFHDWGLAIIVLVIIVRLILHPISKRSQVSMMKMQKMGPEFERLKKKYGDDKEAFTKAQMQLYKEMGFTPVLGCLPMFLQMPIWFALYSALQSEFALRQAPFLWGWTWIHDLARPDRLISFDAYAFTIPLINLKIAALNILPLLMAVVFFLQQKYTPKPPASTPEQATQQKMMQYMTLLFPLFLYTAPSGLNLYIMTSTGMGVLESKRIRDHIKQKEEEEKAGRITIETKATRQGKLNKKQELAEQGQAKPGCIAGWWQNLQQRVEEARRDAERRK